MSGFTAGSASGSGSGGSKQTISFGKGAAPSGASDGTSNASSGGDDDDDQDSSSPTPQRTTSPKSKANGGKSSSSRGKSSSGKSSSRGGGGGGGRSSSSGSGRSTASSSQTQNAQSTIHSLGASSTAALPSASNKNATGGSGVGGSDLSVGAVVGIAVGGAAGLALLGLIAWLLARWSSKPRKTEPSPSRMYEQGGAPVASNYDLPHGDSSASFANSYDAYAQPLQNATYDGYYAGNGYAYRDPVAEAAANVQPPAPVAMASAEPMGYVPGQAITAPQAVAPVVAAKSSTPRARTKKRRDVRANEWVNAEIDPVADYGPDPYRTAGVGSQWASPDELDADTTQRTVSDGQGSWPSSSEMASDKHDEYQDELEETPPRRTRRKKRSTSRERPRRKRVPRAPDAPSADTEETVSENVADDAGSELPYATPRRKRAPRQLNPDPTLDIDQDASFAAESLRATKRHVAHSSRP